MNNETAVEENQPRLVLKRKKMMIIEEEYVAEEIHEQPSEDVFQEVVMHKEPISIMRHPITQSQNIEVYYEDDLEERKELARTVGLDVLPDKTVTAFDSINGIFDELSMGKEVDTVRMVKDLRRRQ
jgi:hypothetical protein